MRCQPGERPGFLDETRSTEERLVYYVTRTVLQRPVGSGLHGGTDIVKYFIRNRPGILWHRGYRARSREALATLVLLRCSGRTLGLTAFAAAPSDVDDLLTDNG